MYKSLHLIFGPPESGKTEALLALYSLKEGLLCKVDTLCPIAHYKDDPDDPFLYFSHVSQLKGYYDESIFIDDFHKYVDFDMDWNYYMNGKSLYLAGLDKDHMGKPFSHMGNFACLATTIEKR